MDGLKNKNPKNKKKTTKQRQTGLLAMGNCKRNTSVLNKSLIANGDINKQDIEMRRRLLSTMSIVVLNRS